MKATLITTVLAAAASALLSFNAQATDGALGYIRESAPPPFADAASMGKTRAQVRAELAEAVARGEVSNGGVPPLARPYDFNYAESAPGPLATTGGKTRAQVKAELAEAVARGEVSNGGVPPLARHLGESGPAPFASRGQKTRAQVKAELAEAIANGELFLGAGSHYRRGYEEGAPSPAARAMAAR